MTALLIGVGIGTLVQVIVQLGGILAGVAVLYVTGLVVSV